MLLRLAPDSNSPQERDIGAAQPNRPCANSTLSTRFDVDWSSGKQAPLAAAWCNRCPVATACLIDALAIDAAYRRGEDRWGLTGVCGGVLFSQERPPRRIEPIELG